MNDKKPLEIISAITLSDTQIARIKNVGHPVRLSTYSFKESANIPAEIWEKAEVLLSSGRNLPGPELAPNLKWIQITYAGVEPAIKASIVKDKHVTATSASGVMISTMGEYALMALLMLGHKIPEMIQLQQQCKWGSNASKSLMPVELRGSTVGIVGYGSIGRQVARLLHPFGAKVLAAKKNVMQPEDKGYTPEGLGDPEGHFFERLYPIEALDGMLPECDFVVIALPLTNATEGMFNREVFAKMKTGAYLVNLARGGVVNEADLEQALLSGQLGGAVLDVFNQEPLPAESPLWKLPNLIITPHVSGVSTHLLDDVITLFTENLKRYLNGQPLYNVIDPDAGY
ncbi:MAG: D-2-hydroxyacid dehydrogenase [Anaerolineaceae bacterium]|jgi:phosphoglycerate dehydrogenase-like enzyme